MDDSFSSFVTYIWQHQPIMIVLLVTGIILFILLVVDTHRHRKKIKKTRHRFKKHSR